MASFLCKSLEQREKCFERNLCPDWLLSILPNRIKSVQLIDDQDNNEEQQQQDQVKRLDIDLSPYQLIERIPILFSEENILLIKTKNSLHLEYPNERSFQFNQLIISPSNEQLSYLFHQFIDSSKQLKKIKNLSKQQQLKQCEQNDCLNKTIPLSLFCLKHFFENDSKQILFVQCSFCQQISIRNDQNNLLHFCLHLF